MSRALLASCLCLFALAANAGPMSRGGNDDPAQICTNKVEKSFKASPIPTSAVTPAPPAAPGSGATAGVEPGAQPHVPHPRIISRRWQTLLPGMIR